MIKIIKKKINMSDELKTKIDWSCKFSKQKYKIYDLLEYDMAVKKFFMPVLEDKYKTLNELILAIDDYINYYNYDRIKVKLKGLSPVNYRLQSSN